MTFRWLGQYDTPGVSMVALIRNNVYRARWLVTNPVPLVGCSMLPLGQIFNLIQDVPGTGPTFPADLRIVGPTELDSVGWEPDKRDVTGRLPYECVVYTQMRSTSDQMLEIGAMQQALAPVGGRLVDFWDATLGIDLISADATGTPAQPPLPPVQPPGPVQPPATPPATPTPTPPSAPKKKKTPAQVVVPWGIAIGVASLLIKLVRS